MKTLDICVFTITNDKIAQSILECKDRGIKIRIITDDVKSTELGSDIEKFSKAVLLKIFLRKILSYFLFYFFILKI